MQAQQLSVKVFAAEPGKVDQAALIPVFHRWIRDAVMTDQVMIDVADYRHVPEGPGVMIVCHAGHLAMDERGGDVGLEWGRKRDAFVDPREGLEVVTRELLQAAEALEGDAERPVGFRGDRLEVRLLSRLAGPNTSETLAAFGPALDALSAKLWPGQAVTVAHHADPRSPFEVILSVAEGAASAAELAKRLG